MTDHDGDDVLDGLLGLLREASLRARLDALLDQVKLHVAIDGYFAHDPRKVQQ